MGGCFVWETGPAMDAREWQARHGFGGVDEDVLEDLLVDYGKPIPAPAVRSGDPKLELSLACIHAVLPDSSLEDAIAYLQRGFLYLHRVSEDRTPLF